MSKQADWTKVVVDESRKIHEPVTDTAASRIEELLKTQLTHRQIPAAELKSLAATLISDMAPQQPETENEDED